MIKLVSRTIERAPHILNNNYEIVEFAILNKKNLIKFQSVLL
jgi:hypothetical protein